MKKSINMWSVDPGLGFDESFRQVRAAGFDGVELNVDARDAASLKPKNALHMLNTPDELATIKAAADANGLKIVSISTSMYGDHMGSPDPEQRAFGQSLCKAQIAYAKALGADGVLTIPSGIRAQQSLKKAYEVSRDTYAELIPYINEMKINVGFENVWNGFFTSPYDMVSLIDGLNCPYIGAYYDVGNVIAFSFSEYWIELLASRIKCIHVKDFKRNRGFVSTGINSGGDFVEIGKGDVNWPAVMPALRNAGFDGYLTAEVFPGDFHREISYPDMYKAISESLDAIIAL